MEPQQVGLETTENTLPNPKPTHQTTVAKWCAVSSIGFAIYFLLLGHWIDIDSPLIGGPKRLLIDDNIGLLSIHRTFSSLEMVFDEPASLAAGIRLDQIKDGVTTILNPTVYEVGQSGDRRVLTVQRKNGESFAGETRITLPFKGSDPGDFPTRKFIKAVLVDRQEVSLTSFYQDSLDVRNSNVQYYKSFAIQNISNYLARTVGVQLLYAVTALLLILFAGQVIVFFGTILEDLLYQELQFGSNARVPINWLDFVSEEYATFLGFLGTVLSLWVALEQSNMDFSNYFQLLALIKYAVFTTVLGLLIRSTYGVREFFFRFRSTADAERK